MVVLQQNTTEFRWGTIINDIEVSTRGSPKSSPWTDSFIFEQLNQWLGVLGYTYRMEVANLQTIEYFAHAWLTCDDSKGSKNNLSRIHGGNLHQVHMN